MKAFVIILVLIISGCTESGRRILNAEITGEKYTIYTCSGGSYKVDDYHIYNSRGVISFSNGGNEYKSNCWLLKTTKHD